MTQMARRVTGLAQPECRHLDVQPSARIQGTTRALYFAAPCIRIEPPAGGEGDDRALLAKFLSEPHGTVTRVQAFRRPPAFPVPTHTHFFRVAAFCICIVDKGG